MTLAICYGRALFGLDAPLVTIETDLGMGLPSMAIVGLPQAAVKESKDRVRSAIQNSGFDFPYAKTVINLAPADLPKSGGRFDLAIALGLLAASRQVPMEAIKRYECLAELALNGELRPVDGVLPAAIAAKQSSRILLVAPENADEAALVKDLKILVCRDLKEVVASLHAEEALEFYRPQLQRERMEYADLSEVQGQTVAKRALEIAAAGRHSVLFCGSPGTGKTMLASRLPSILPDMSEDDAQQTAAVYSISHLNFNMRQWKVRPFRMPHHSASAVALVGGGSPPRPGEISLAHHGTLFLDELPEFQRNVLESLREPLESGHIIISRAARQVQFPASFQLIAAMNPCPCGYHGDTQKECQCSHEQIQRYRNKISGPFLDRIDIRLHVERVSLKDLNKKTKNETSADIKRRVIKAQEIQISRQDVLNANLSSSKTKEVCKLSQLDEDFFIESLEKLHVSGRSYFRLLRVARTIADLVESERVERAHLLEAMHLNLGF